MGGAINNHDGTVSYTSISFDVKEGKGRSGVIEVDNYQSVENQSDIITVSNDDDDVTLPESDDYEFVPNTGDDDDTTGGGGTGEPIKQIPIENLATRAVLKVDSGSSLERYVLKPNGIVFEKPPFTLAAHTKLKILDISRNNSLIRPNGHINAEGLGIIGTYQLTGPLNSAIYDNVKVWLDIEGAVGLENLDINISNTYQFMLESLVLPPQYGWSEDEYWTVMVPEGIIVPGESFNRDVKITLANSLRTANNGAGKSGAIFNDDGDIIALYDLLGEDINEDGTKTYDNIEIQATKILTPYEPLILKMNPMTEANENTYSFDLPNESYRQIDADVLSKMKDFLEENDYSEEAVDAAKKVIILNTSEQAISFYPLIKYPANKALQYKTDYPKLTDFLQNELPKIAQNQKIVNEIHELTNVPINTIKEALQWGNKGPEIIIEQLGGEGDFEKYGSYRGHLDLNEINIIRLDVDLANDMENLEKSQKFRDEIGFLIAVTLLHEYTHLGDFTFGESFWGELFAENSDLENEVGIVFENSIFGETVWRSNAGIIMRNFKNW